MKKITNVLVVVCLIIGVTIIDGCKKEADGFGSVTDVDGNAYKTIAIGTQVWMAQNLKTTKLNNKTAILNVAENTDWANLTTPAYCWYNNEVVNKDTYGALYNWFTIKTGKLCPTGWHAPTDEEYNKLALYLGMAEAQVNLWGWQGTDQGTQMKNTTGWTDAGGNGTNKSGFTALPGGYRQATLGTFSGIGTLTYFWSSTDDSINNKSGDAWYRRLDGVEKKIYKATTFKTGGKYIRCVQN